MKLALLVEYYPPSRASAAVQMSDLARALVREGHDVTVFTTSPEVSGPCLQLDGGIKVLRVPTRKVKGMTLGRRALSEIFMSLALWRGARRCAVPIDDLEGIIWYSPTIFLAPLVAWLKYRSRARAYLILRDMFPQWALDAGVMRRGPAYYFFRAFEIFQYRTADIVGVQSPANFGQARRDAGQREIEVLFNWLDLNPATPRHNDVIDAHGLQGKRILVYGGNMGVAQDMDNLLRLAERIRDEHTIALLLVGAGSEVERIGRALRERTLANIVMIPEVDPAQFRAVLRRCHIGLITLDRRLTTHNIPGKLLAYLEAGLPIIASVNPGNDLIEILRESGAGIGLINGEDDAFARAARELALDPGRCAEMSAKARILAHERFTVSSAMRQLISGLARDAEVRRVSSRSAREL